MIFEQYSYKQKFFALLVLSVIMAITAYKRSFKNSLYLLKENKELKQKIELVNEKSGELQNLNMEIKTIDSFMGKENVDMTKVRQEILNFLANSKNTNILVTSFPSPHTYSDQNYTIYSNVLEISGTFNELLETAYEFEKYFTYSKVVSTEFFTVKKGSDKKELHLIIIFQNYENRN